ncbi:hypothetical protein DBT_0537 [Dissulfuribacter thermophilus]|uniref:PilZ domain-containing protein n=1 Tax=Dissulfuribacter thermophilus TaxID=1156395 RepID=A0A1B9F8D9_9BACT|nr:PilZ domain-containing protein [Dissulfuribacter thermophilus]OCC16075.1 hypothetical protein DBT_0537 [Dissulfuribacter thermophilus]
MFQTLDGSKASEKGWVWKNEVQYTSNPGLIGRELERLIRDATWVELRTPGYRSAPTIIIDMDNSSITVDKPVDWKEASEVILTYRRKGEPWNFLKAKAKATQEKTLIFSRPYLWAILERREFYRIQCPSGCTIRLYPQKGEPLEGIIKDISLKGVGIEWMPPKGAKLPSLRKHFSSIFLSLRLVNSKDICHLEIRGGEIRRIQRPGRFGPRIYRIGLQLYPDSNQTNQLSSYIRKRELELLRLLNQP